MERDMKHCCKANTDGNIHMPIFYVTDLIIDQKKQNDKFAYMMNFPGD